MSTTLPRNYTPPRWLPSERLQTCAGVVIGGAIAPPVTTMTQDGERIQAALLEHAAAEHLRELVDAFDADRRMRLPVALALWIAAIAAGTGALAVLLHLAP